jgi:sporulation protein YlmC with PRC-barrel domain
MHAHIRAGFIIVTLSVASPVLAQPPSNSTTTSNSTTAAVAAPKWLTQEAAGQWRASKLIGLNVYNDDNEKIGGITELIVDDSGKLDAVVIGAGGFLGLGEHDVAIPYDQITWMYLPGPQSPTNAPISNGLGQTGTWRVRTLPRIKPSWMPLARSHIRTTQSSRNRRSNSKLPRPSSTPAECDQRGAFWAASRDTWAATPDSPPCTAPCTPSAALTPALASCPGEANRTKRFTGLHSRGTKSFMPA